MRAPRRFPQSLMPLDPISLSSTLLIGSAVGLGAFAGRDALSRGLDFVERDVADKLRALRISTRSLRSWLVAWAGSIIGVLLVLGIGLDSLVPAICISALLCLPALVHRPPAGRAAAAAASRTNSPTRWSRFPTACGPASRCRRRWTSSPSRAPAPFATSSARSSASTTSASHWSRRSSKRRSGCAARISRCSPRPLLASRRSGGKLNETVERIAHSVLEMQRLERKVASETAQARKSAVYMAIAPAVHSGRLLLRRSREHVALFTTFFGQVLLSVAMVLNVVAYLWARFILTPDI